MAKLYGYTFFLLLCLKIAAHLHMKLLSRISLNSLKNIDDIVVNNIGYI